MLSRGVGGAGIENKSRPENYFGKTDEWKPDWGKSHGSRRGGSDAENNRSAEGAFKEREAVWTRGGEECQKNELKKEECRQIRNILA